MKPKKHVNIVVRFMGETLLLSIILFIIIIYLMQSYGYVQPFETWIDRMKATLSIWFAVAIVTSIFAFFQGYRIKRRIELLRESMFF